MATHMNIDAFLKLIPELKNRPDHAMWLTFDEEADTLYINFKKAGAATDSELSDDDVIVRYEGDQVIGLTVLHASRR